MTGVITALIAFLIGLDALADAISIGTLCAFSVVDAGIIVQRYGVDVTAIVWLGREVVVTATKASKCFAVAVDVVCSRKDVHDSRRVVVAVGLFSLSAFIATLAFNLVRNRLHCRRWIDPNSPPLTAVSSA